MQLRFSLFNFQEVLQEPHFEYFNTISDYLDSIDPVGVWKEEHRIDVCTIQKALAYLFLKSLIIVQLCHFSKLAENKQL